MTGLMAPQTLVDAPTAPESSAPAPEPSAILVAVVTPPTGREITWAIVLLYLVAFGSVFWLGLLTML